MKSILKRSSSEVDSKNIIDVKVLSLREVGKKVESQSAGAAMFFVIVNISEDFAISEWNVRKGDFKHFFVPK